MVWKLSPVSVWRHRIPRYRLIGKECKKCGKHHYPPKLACPYCGSRDLKNIELPRSGIIETYTVIYEVGEEFRHKAPVVIGLVKLDDGTRVIAPITDVAEDELEIGLRVEATFRRIRDGDHFGVIGYGLSFRPIRTNVSKTSS